MSQPKKNTFLIMSREYFKYFDIKRFNWITINGYSEIVTNTLKKYREVSVSFQKYRLFYFSPHLVSNDILLCSYFEIQPFFFFFFFFQEGNIKTLLTATFTLNRSKTTNNLFLLNYFIAHCTSGFVHNKMHDRKFQRSV